MDGVRVPGSPTARQGCTSPLAQALASRQPQPCPALTPTPGRRDIVNPRLFPPTDKAQNFLSGGISTLNLSCTFRLAEELYKNRAAQTPLNQ